MAISAKINNISVSVLNETLKIDKRIEERSTASFVVRDLTGAEVYVRGMPVTIYDSVPSLIFAGFIDTPGRVRISPSGGLFHDIVCMDNHYLADKRLVVKPYSDKTLSYIVNDIWTDYLDAEGITIGEVQTGPTIKSAIFNYVKASEAFDALKELSGFTWFIDENEALYFIARETYSATWQLDGVTHKPLEGSVRLSTGNPLYRNVQYKRGGKGATSLQTEHFTGDGIIKAFTVGYPIAQVPSVWVNEVAQDVGIKGIDEGEHCYWNKGDATISFEAAPGDTLDVEIQYHGQYPLIAKAVDHSAILSRQAIEGGSGMIEDIVTETQHESSDSMLESTKAALKEYCRDAEKFIYQTYESGLQPGQIQQVTYAPFGFSAHEMLIESISVTASGEYILYEVFCITGPSMGSWAKFFTNLLSRQDKMITIGDSLLLVLLQQIESLVLVEVTDRHEDAEPCTGRWLITPPAEDDNEGHHLVHEKLALAEAPSRESIDFNGYVWGGDGLEDNLVEYPYTYPFEYYYKVAVWDFFSWG